MNYMDDASTFERSFLQKARQQHIPITGALELLPLCNMKMFPREMSMVTGFWSWMKPVLCVPPHFFAMPVREESPQTLYHDFVKK